MRLRSAQDHALLESPVAVRQHTGEPVTDPTTLRVHPGADGQFTLYDDDGESREYLAGRGSWIRLTWNDRARELTIEPGAPPAMTNVPAERHFRVVRPDGAAQDVFYRGARVVVGLR